jgi:hypothetical protein
LHRMPAPHIPAGSAQLRTMIKEIGTVPSGSPRFSELVKAITANFDEFHESQSHHGGAFDPSNQHHQHHGHQGNNNNTHNSSSTGSGSTGSGRPKKHSPAIPMPSPTSANGTGGATKQEADAAFYNYTYKRQTVRTMSLTLSNQSVHVLPSFSSFLCRTFKCSFEWLRFFRILSRMLYALLYPLTCSS